jgi:long-chain acyl-CoA synthetase
LLVVADAKAWQKICATGQDLPELQAVIHAQQGRPIDSSNAYVVPVEQAEQDSVKALQRKPVIVLSAWLQAGQRHTSALPATKENGAGGHCLHLRNDGKAQGRHAHSRQRGQ